MTSKPEEKGGGAPETVQVRASVDEGAAKMNLYDSNERPLLPSDSERRESRDPFSEFPQKPSEPAYNPCGYNRLFYFHHKALEWRERWEPVIQEWHEKAEKWDKLHREDPDATIDIYEEFDKAIEELNDFRDRLEAIKNHIRDCRGPFFDTIRKIISGEEYAIRAAIEGSQTAEKEVRKSG